MRKYISSISAVLLTMAMFVACQSASSRLADEAALTAEHCPMEIGPFALLTGVDYDRNANEITYTVLVDETYVPMSVIGLDTDTTLVIKALRNAAMTNGRTKELFELMEKAGSKMKIVYNGSETGRNAQMSLSEIQIAKEVLDTTHTEISQWRDFLVNTLEGQSHRLPEKMDDNMYITSLKIDGNWINYTVTLTAEGSKTFAESGRTAEQVKASMMRMFHATKSGAQFATLVRDTGFSLRYIFMNDKEEKVLQVEIPNSEIK